jgi:UDP-N-acetylglucosamine 3-dehydrogenase
MIKFGLIGYGFMGKIHAANIQKMPDCQIDAIYSAVTETNLPIGANFYENWKDLIDNAKIDAVVIATPTTTHSEIACYAAAKGLHIFLEKPMARTVEQCNAILDAVNKAKIKLFIGHVIRFWPSYATAFTNVHANEKPIGEIRMIRARRFVTVPGWSNWFADEALSGGCILDLSIHDIDYASWVIGSKAREIFCEARRLPELNMDNWGLSYTTITYENESIAQCESSWAAKKTFPFFTDCEIIGTEGIARFNSQAQIPVKIYGETGIDIQDPFQADGYYLEIVAFINCIKNNSVPLVSGEDGKYAVALCIAALMSVHEKRPVLLSEVLL